MNHRSFVKLAITYAEHRKENQANDFPFVLDASSIAYPFELWKELDMDSTHIWFDDYIHDRLDKYPKAQLRKLDIWDEDFMTYYNITDPRTIIDKLLHRYFHWSFRFRQKHTNVVVRAIDKVLQKVYG